MERYQECDGVEMKSPCCNADVTFVYNEMTYGILYGEWEDGALYVSSFKDTDTSDFTADAVCSECYNVFLKDIEVNNV